VGRSVLATSVSGQAAERAGEVIEHKIDIYEHKIDISTECVRYNRR
jgi:hypothetical protein